MEVDNHVKESLGIESLLDDSVDGQDAATSKLSDAAALAESFQPKGNTLESTKVQLQLLLALLTSWQCPVLFALKTYFLYSTLHWSIDVNWVLFFSLGNSQSAILTQIPFERIPTHRP